MWLIAINPHSGNGKGAEAASEVVRYLSLHDISYRSIAAASAEELTSALIRELDSKSYHGVIAVGGDGLAHLVLQVVVPRHIPFAIVPAGTGNDFVRTLGWSLDDIEPLLKRVTTTEPTPIDLGNVDSEWFGAILSTGFDSIVNERANKLRWPRGPQRYNVAIAMELPRFKASSYEITADGNTFTTDAMLIAVGNGKSYGGGMNVCPQAQINDGLFDITILQPVSTIEFIKVFPTVYSGSHISHPQVKTMRAKRVSISAQAVAYADGERIGPAPVSAECVKDAALTWKL
jgi:diacylglycerol kinase (ATP)